MGTETVSAQTASGTDRTRTAIHTRAQRPLARRDRMRVDPSPLFDPIVFALHDTLDVSQVVRAIEQATASIAACDRAVVLVARDGVLETDTRQRFAARAFPHLARALAHTHVTDAADILDLRLTDAEREWLSALPARSAVLLPLRAGETPIGVAALVWTKQRTRLPSTVTDQLATVARHAALALRHALAHQRACRERDIAAACLAVSREIASSNVAADIAAAVERGLTALVDGARALVRFDTSDASECATALSHMRVPVDAGGRIVAMVHLHADRPRAFGLDETRVVDALASHLGAALHRASLFAEVQTLAVTDPLTGIANRRRFEERLATEMARARRTHQPLSLIVLDVDDFKALNDVHGHPGGDRALVTLARALDASVRATDLAARIGGDEFALLLPDTPAAGARTVFTKILRRATSLAAQSDSPLFTLSGGIAAVPDHAESVAELLARADAALYAAKTSGKNTAAVARS